MKLPVNILKNVFEKTKQYEQDDVDRKQLHENIEWRKANEQYDRVMEETQD